MKTRATKILGGLAIACLTAALSAPALLRTEPAGAFGTVVIPGTSQRVVHEKITRVLACAPTHDLADCFQPVSMSMLAGTGGTFGAVGEPDNPLDGNPNPAHRHCDDGDHGYGSPHSQEDAQAEILKCLDAYQFYMDFAFGSADALLEADGTIDPAATDLVNFWGSTYNACTFPDPYKGHTSDDSAKCNVLNGLGRALHLYEDFWSHSNWADEAAPDREVGLTNPTGLANVDQPGFFDYARRETPTLPEGLITGCDDSLSSSRCTGRTGHSVLNKDNGETVSPETCTVSDPLTERGKVVVDGTSNFERAVTGACGAALKAWRDLRAALVAAHGPERAATMVRAIVQDSPLTACQVSGGAAKAKAPPVGEQSSMRSVKVQLVNQTGSALTCSQAILDGGEWANYPADAVAPGATHPGARRARAWPPTPRARPSSRSRAHGRSSRCTGTTPSSGRTATRARPAPASPARGAAARATTPPSPTPWPGPDPPRPP